MVQLPHHTPHDEMPRISVEELKKLVDENADIVILDVQQKRLYLQGHIKGAMHFPWKQQITAIDARYLPKDKPLIVYCDCGPRDTDSSEVAAALVALGFADVRVLTDPSIKGWMEAGYAMEP